ncbi:thioesterase II family protein [Thalassospira marina]|uniref:Thioesterase domain-containing protein n=1 Tax=Thalassospira marina TaxID=2048283 RepID=A0A2N3KTR3_9PROT|nr:alpha/beta fold hydrolase [Thalassospira marina]AUG55742.1 hypothetical protein CSC3H3_23130 [Thalassospira marina]PKR53863.1 hypothetical protein COO20_12710 [Thalassospira marina]
MSRFAEIFGNARPDTCVDLYAFHHAGGSRHSFAAWQNRFPRAINVYRAQLPGRTPESYHFLPRKVAELIPDLAACFLRSRFGNINPFVFYGHSLGALVAFELTRFLRQHSKTLPIGLIVSSRRAPQCPLVYSELCSLRDDLLLPKLEELGGVPAYLKAKPDELRRLLPVVRADLLLSDRYDYNEQPPFDLPVLATKGLHDPIMSLAELKAWSDQTTGKFECLELSGAHFFDSHGSTRLEKLLTETVIRWGNAPSPTPRKAILPLEETQC